MEKTNYTMRSVAIIKGRGLNEEYKDVEKRGSRRNEQGLRNDGRRGLWKEGVSKNKRSGNHSLIIIKSRHPTAVEFHRQQRFYRSLLIVIIVYT